MNQKIIYTICLSFFYMLTSFAQLHVDENQNIGIGVEDAGDSKTLIENNGSTRSLELLNNFTTNNTKYGLYNKIDEGGYSEKYGIANYVYQRDNTNKKISGVYNYLKGTSTNAAFGVHNYIAEEGVGYKVGVVNEIFQSSNGGNVLGIENHIHTKTTNSSGNVYGILNWVHPNTTSATSIYGLYIGIDNLGGGANRVGVYSTLNGHSGYAGWFQGDVNISGGMLMGSDAKLKEDIKDMGSCIATLDKIKPRRYKLKTETARGEKNKEHYGFVAQELEAVLPDLVQTIPALPSVSGIDGTETTSTESYKAINYIELIPFMMQALKEQQAQIEELTKKVKELSK